MEVRTKYNILASFEKYTRKKDQHLSYPVHKSLMFHNEELGSRARDIAEWIREEGDFQDGMHVLDAGCGNGNTLFKLIEDINITGTGISLSEEEIFLANKSLNRLSLQGSLSFKNRSYDIPWKENFERIIAIESLKHSNNLKRSISSLSSMLHEEGFLIIVEDTYACRDYPPGREWNILKKEWALHELYSLDDYLLAARESGLRIIKNIDLSDGVHFRPIRSLNRLIGIFHFFREICFLTNLKNLLGIFLAGFIFEKLYALDYLKYRLLIFENAEKYN